MQVTNVRIRDADRIRQQGGNQRGSSETLIQCGPGVRVPRNDDHRSHVKNTGRLIEKLRTANDKNVMSIT